MSTGPQTRFFTLVVRYSETDAQGVVHHANYLKWFEEGRSDFLRQQGCKYSIVEEAGFFVIVAQATVDYKAPSFFEDKITIATTLEKGKGRVLEFSYKATNQDETIVAIGRTKHVVLNRDRKLVAMPEEFRVLLDRDSP